jgi:hypothetical protein
LSITVQCYKQINTNSKWRHSGGRMRTNAQDANPPDWNVRLKRIGGPEDVREKVKQLLGVVIAVLVACTTSSVCFADDMAAPEAEQGLLPVPDYSGKIGSRTTLTGDWAGVRQDWANRGITLGFDWYQSYQNIVDGGFEEDDAYSTNLDYRLNLDLMRLGLVPGAVITVRGQSRFR